MIYHSNVGKAAVGTAKVVSVGATDPRNPIRRINREAVAARETAGRDARGEDISGVGHFRQFRLSVVPLTEEQYDGLTRG